MSHKVKVIHAEDDPQCPTRISVGGGEAVGGYYCTYRGPLKDCITALLEAASALSQIEPGKEPPIDHEIRRINDTRN